LNSSQTVLKYLKDTKVNISSILIMARNIADSIDLYMFKATNHVPTKYSDNQNVMNLDPLSWIKAQLLY